MQETVNDINNIVQLFLEYFYKNFSPLIIIFIIYVIYCAVFICNYSLKGIILSFLGSVLAYICYLLIYDITYIQFLISLRLDVSIKVIINHYFPFFLMINMLHLKQCLNFLQNIIDISRTIFFYPLLIKFF